MQASRHKFKDEESIIQGVMDAMEASLRTQKSILGTTPPEQSDYSHSCSSTTPQILLKISALSKWIQRDASSIIIEETFGWHVFCILGPWYEHPGGYAEPELETSHPMGRVVYNLQISFLQQTRGLGHSWGEISGLLIWKI